MLKVAKGSFSYCSGSDVGPHPSLKLMLGIANGTVTMGSMGAPAAAAEASLVAVVAAASAMVKPVKIGESNEYALRSRVARVWREH